MLATGGEVTGAEVNGIVVAGAVVTVVLELSKELYHHAQRCNSHLAQQPIDNPLVKQTVATYICFSLLIADLKSCSGHSLLSISAIQFLATSNFIYTFVIIP